VNSVSRLWRLAPSDNPQDEPAGRASAPVPREQDEFPYRVEVWNYTGSYVEQTLAITISRSIAFAAYYAAMQGLSDGLITLRHKGAVLAHWNARKH
jgi:hypothetical protein